MQCPECSGSGACDPCGGYGTYSESYPNAGDGPDCDICDADGICPECAGSGQIDPTNNHDNNSSRYSGSDQGVSA
jgi:hypothetical protein